MHRVVATLVALVAVVSLVAGCGGDDAAVLRAASSSTTAATVPATATPTTVAPMNSAPTTAAPMSAVPTVAAPTTAAVRRPAATPRVTAAPAPAGATTQPPPPPTTTAPAAQPPVTEPFESSVRVIDDGIAARMTASWRAGCPVGLDDLRLVIVSHWGFDGRPQVGEVVVHVRSADALVGVFERLFRARFPIERMRLVDEYGADDDRSMAANNTSAFNCRTVAGSTRWSEHAYGSAIDINPVQNPYVTRSGVSPPAGVAHTGRSASTPGLITRDGPAVAAFGAIGWGWGGSWSSGKDYQHFSASGR